MEWCNAQAVLCFQAALAQSISIGRRAGAAPLRIVFSGCLCIAQRQPETLLPPRFRFQHHQHIPQPLAPLLFGHNRLAALAPQNIQITLRHFVNKAAWLGEHKRALPLALDAMRERELLLSLTPLVYTW